MANGAVGARQTRRKTSTRTGPRTAGILVSLLSVASPAMAQDNGCVSLQGSKACPAFSSASVSTGSYLVGLFPFLRDVRDTASFDQQMASYVRTSYVEQKYRTLLGCGNVDLTNTSDLYARFTTSVVCNSIVQNSIQTCGLTGSAARPLCADNCAQYAESEAYIVADESLCANPNGNAQDQIRADFTNCALPANALSSSNCIPAIANEPSNCGYADSTIGICSYCSSGGINSTDTCCYNSDIEDRCKGVELPAITPSMTFGTPVPTATSMPDNQGGDKKGLSGGAIAGIVIGSIFGLALLAFLIFMCIRLSRRGERPSQKSSIFNQPSPSRSGPSSSAAHAPQMASNAPQLPPQGYEMLPGGRIARMSALEGHSGDSPSRHGGSRHGESRHGDSRHGTAAGLAGAGAGAAAAYMATRKRGDTDHSSSDEFGESPRSEPRAGVLRPPPMTSRRTGSLSSSSMLAGEDPQSPTSAGGMSGAGVGSQQSEQLPFFKDYYSQDDIHPGERVAVLWAYQPRAPDEFALERGDMLKVVGIWDDGWATGVMIDERAEEWEARRQAQRDSGVSNTSGRGRDNSPPISGEIKAFPLVCVCLPEHWRKTIEGDGSTETTSSVHPGGPFG